jgi:hypothetical protein
MRYIDLREILELTIATLLGLGAALVILEHHRGWIPRGLSSDAWLLIGAGAGFLLAVVWSAWRVDRRVDKRLPRHLRPMPKFSEGRPVGVAAWRTKDAASEYLWLLLGVLVAGVIIWLAKTFVPR